MSVSFGNPSSLAVDAQGNVFFANNECIFKVTADGTVTLFAGNGRSGYSGDGGPASLAQLGMGPLRSAHAGGVAIDGAGNLFIAEADNNRVRKVSANGIISTVAGRGNLQDVFTDDKFDPINGPLPAADALISIPVGVATDRAGNLYILTSGGRVFKVSGTGCL
jgi:hypothetical protein